MKNNVVEFMLQYIFNKMLLLIVINTFIVDGSKPVAQIAPDTYLAGEIKIASSGMKPQYESTFEEASVSRMDYKSYFVAGNIFVHTSIGIFAIRGGLSKASLNTPSKLSLGDFQNANVPAPLVHTPIFRTLCHRSSPSGEFAYSANGEGTVPAILNINQTTSALGANDTPTVQAGTNPRFIHIID